MTAIKRFKTALNGFDVDDEIKLEIFKDYPSISDQSKKEKKASFFIQAVNTMDQSFDESLCRNIRDACACSKGGWRLKAMQKIAKTYPNEPLETKIEAINQVTYMGKPVINPDGTITAGIGEKGGFACPCPVFDGVEVDEAVSITYCYCCAGHFRYHYQIALGIKLETIAVTSSALASQRKEPCRFVYKIVE